MPGVKTKVGGPNRPCAGCWGLALKLRYKPNKTLNIHAVGSVCGCTYQCWWDLHRMTSMKRALSRPNPVNCACCTVVGCVIAHISSTFVVLQLDLARLWRIQYVKCGCWFAKNGTCGLKHGQPAQRTVFQAILVGFSWVLDCSWSQLSPNRVPIWLMMFLYEAHH